MAEKSSSPINELMGSGKGVVVLLALVAASLFPTWVLDSSRPPGRPLPVDPIEDTAPGEHLLARLWQDPLAVAYQDKAKLSSKQGEGADPTPNLESLHGYLEREIKGESGGLLVLPVTVVGGSRTLQVENRLRYRYAVVSALGTSGYVPVDGERIGYFVDGEAVIPYELFRRVSHDAARPPEGRWSRVLVLWIDGDLLRYRPALRIMWTLWRVIACGDSKHFEAPQAEGALSGLWTWWQLLTGTLPLRTEVRVLWTTGSTSLIGLLQDWNDLAIEVDQGRLGLDQRRFLAKEDATAHATAHAEEATSSEPQTDTEAHTSADIRPGMTEVVEAVFSPEGSHGHGGSQPAAKLAFDAREAFSAWWRETAPGRIYSVAATVPDDLLRKSLSIEELACEIPLQPRQTVIFEEEPSDPEDGDQSPAANAGDEPWKQSSYKLSVPTVNGEEAAWELYRTIGDDEDLVRAMLREIAMRAGRRDGRPPGRLDLIRAKLGTVARRLGWSGPVVVPGPGAPTGIALFAEWDTDYGRAWKRIFEDMRLNDPEFKQWNLGIDYFVYLNGIDGRVVSDTQSSSGSEDADLTRAEARGTGRIDYILRLVDRIRSEHPWGRPYQAIGVLGSDVHDKLLLLSVLRHRFPGTIFFTTDLDARYLDPKGWDYLRNLVVTSHYGLDLHRDLQGNVPTFRNSYQASVFHGTLVALEHEEALTRGTNGACVYEMGRDGAYDLTPLPTEDEPRRWDPTRRVERDPLRSSELRQRLPRLFGALALIFGLSIVMLRIAAPSLNDQSPHIAAQRRWTGSILGLALVALLVAYLAQARAVDREPFAFFEGISVWPSEVLRLTSVALAVGWSFRVFGELREEVARTEIGLGIKPDEAPAAISTDVRLGILRQLMEDNRRAMEEDPPAPEPSAWTRCRRRFLGLCGWPHMSSTPRTAIDAYDEFEVWSHARNRRRRTVVHLLLFMLLASCVFSFWGERPFTPVRGTVATVFDRVALFLGVVTMQWLIFLVLDSCMIVSRFLRRLCSPELAHPEMANSEKTPREKYIKDEYIWSKRRIEVAADLTACIGRFLYYPSFIVLLMVLSRLPLFDDWSWSPPLVVVISLSLLVLAVCYILSWSAARQLRRGVLAQLNREKGEVFGDQKSTKALDELASYVARLRRGAFAPFWEHPLLRAILIPFAGLGSFSVLEFLRR